MKRTRSRRRRVRTSMLVQYVGVLLLLLSGSHRCSADDMSNTTTTKVETFEPTMEPTPEPTAEPTPTFLATLAPVLEQILTAPTVELENPGEINAYFHLDFDIRSGLLEEGHMNETEVALFEFFMGRMQRNYLPRDVYELIVVDCYFLQQGFFVDGDELIFFPSVLTEAPTVAPTMATTSSTIFPTAPTVVVEAATAQPQQPTPQATVTTTTTTSAPVTRAPQQSNNNNNNARQRWLESVQWNKQFALRQAKQTKGKHNNTTTIPSIKRNATLSSKQLSNNKKKKKRRFLQQQQQLTGLNGTHHFRYSFQMHYRSNSPRANLTDRPGELQEYVNTNKENISIGLAQIIGVLPYERLAIVNMNETAAITDAPTTSPSAAPSASFAPSAAPSISAAPSLSSSPSALPSNPPSQAPSLSPTLSPSAFPTFVSNQTELENVEVHFTVIAPPTAGYMNESQEEEFCAQMVSRTAVFAPDAVDRVVSECTFFVESFIVEAIPVTLAPTTQQELISTATPAPQTRRRLRRQPQPKQTNSSTTKNATLLPPSWRKTRSQWKRWISANKRNTTNTTTTSSTTTTTTNTILDQRRIQEASDSSVRHTYIYPFRMRYTSDSEDLENFTTLFLYNLADSAAWFNPMLTEILHLNASNELQIQQVTTFITKSSAPTMSLMPSESPTNFPTEPQPTYFPTLEPTERPPPTDGPTLGPSFFNENLTEAIASRADGTGNNDGEGSNGSNNENTLIIVIIVVAIVSLASLAGMAWFYKTRQSKMQQLLMENMSANAAEEHSSRSGARGRNKHGTVETSRGGRYDVTVATSPLSSSGDGMANYQMQRGGGNNLVMSPSTSESILSNPSLLSNGQGDDDDDEEEDLVAEVDDPLERHSKLSPLDELDRFKDQNLEKMRSDVEDNVTGMDGMMSQALTMALMPGGDNASGLLWAGASDPMQIEANALWEVTDWMKRNEGSSVDDKQTFMQLMLNKMVTSVRQGILGPDDASRTIHECAFLLNLQLANDLPPTTIILSGMRKTVRANDVLRAFRRFGHIDDAAVASNQRGFGVVRFRSPKAADDAHSKFKTGEIVVQDVAVQVRVLKPESQ
ncbi:expressed unknown protein [Seminavis robusta]|uniref:RRM domain-containing protein n=1 Tax=Seminavis robusta TaxID=568900 RepID=A0A9N8DJM5_9STRA|nr:expressed unknown protein [Seminavis robusta]|eukprot:Sro122_g059230.1 n/a (1090) ;mRNA; r:55930-59416